MRKSACGFTSENSVQCSRMRVALCVCGAPTLAWIVSEQCGDRPATGMPLDIYASHDAGHAPSAGVNGLNDSLTRKESCPISEAVKEVLKRREKSLPGAALAVADCGSHGLARLG